MRSSVLSLPSCLGCIDSSGRSNALNVDTKLGNILRKMRSKSSKNSSTSSSIMVFDFSLRYSSLTMPAAASLLSERRYDSSLSMYDEHFDINSIMYMFLILFASPRQAFDSRSLLLASLSCSFVEVIWVLSEFSLLFISARVSFDLSSCRRAWAMRLSCLPV